MSEDIGVDMDTYIRERSGMVTRIAHESGAAAWDIFEDAQQEARIGIWEAKRDHPEVPLAYVRKAGKNRVTQGVSREQWYGYEAHRGHPVDPLRRRDRDSLDDPDWDTALAAADALDKVLLAYHEGEIMQALADLPPKQREYVVLRFWGGYTTPEIADALGVKSGSLRGVWAYHIKPKLRDRLAHLADVAETL